MLIIKYYQKNYKKRYKIYFFNEKNNLPEIENWEK